MCLHTLAADSHCLSGGDVPSIWEVPSSLVPVGAGFVGLCGIAYPTGYYVESSPNARYL